MAKISIITINYNNATGLKRTIESVLSQNICDLEYIVIDGDSTDDSKSVLSENQNEFSYWISEKDVGVYDAMNKGIKKATGDYLLFLNSGDHFFSNDVLIKNRNHLHTDDIIAFDIQMLGFRDPFIVQAPDRMDFSYLYKQTLSHQAVFIKRNLFDTVGFYNENLKIVADWKFFIDAFTKFNVSYRAVHKTLSSYYLDGISATGEGSNLRKKERREILNNEYSLFNNDYKKLRKLESNRFLMLIALEDSKLAQKLNSIWLRVLLFVFCSKRLKDLK